MTMAQIRKAGYEITRGDYQGTNDNNARRWYVQPISGPVDRRGRGFATRREARFALEDLLSLTEA